MQDHRLTLVARHARSKSLSKKRKPTSVAPKRPRQFDPILQTSMTVPLFSSASLVRFGGRSLPQSNLLMSPPVMLAKYIRIGQMFTHNAAAGLGI
jgi:hypothetical protein